MNERNRIAIPRRRCLQGGAAALMAGALTGVLPSGPARAQSAGSAPKRLITVLAYGGWDTTWVLDPKPGLATVDAPEGEVTPFGALPIFTHETRPATTAFFQQHGHRCALLRGIEVRSLSHSECARRLLTGTNDHHAPSFGAQAAAHLGAALPAPYLVLGPTAFSGPHPQLTCRAGTVTQLLALMKDEQMFPPLPADTPAALVPNDAEQALLQRYQEQRLARARERFAGLPGAQARLEQLQLARDRADQLEALAEDFGAELTFTLGLPAQVELALRALQTNMTASVHIEQAFAGWDTHAANTQQGIRFEELFVSLSMLAEGLLAMPGEEEGSTMLDETLVVVVSEMGRMPRLNDAGGKDHWPVTAALLFGGCVNGGTLAGATGPNLEALPVDLQSGQPSEAGQPLQYGHFVAGMLAALGLPDGLAGFEPFTAWCASG